ncbi:hypothetical protein F8M41_016505 [Gigaspora margarita]|uniref:Uncharacterized protein n=1 Tax=Gigaspora margarita TaxID=4874 RepID=A0A8H3WVM0_GIGMA|nr:hypothetical protein F8M41_016505 [Gigaspora margarita]
MPNQIHENCFKRKVQDWNVIDFLDECELPSFRQKIECYLSSLEMIIAIEKGQKREKAQFLFDKYKKGSQPDYILARKWEYERKQVYVVRQTYTAVNYGNTGSINVTNNNGTMDETNKIKRIKSNRQSTLEDQIRPSLIFPGVEDKPARQQEQIADDYEFINSTFFYYILCITNALTIIQSSRK